MELYELFDGKGNVIESRAMGSQAVPEEISPRQFRQALNHFGFRQQVDGGVAASGDQDLQDWYEFTSVVQRHHPKVLAMAPQLGFTDDQLDQVWIYGATL